MAKATVLGPDQMIKQWQEALPDEIIETFNELLAKYFDGRFAVVKEQELLTALSKKGLTCHKVRDQRWLYQTQELYKEKGWKVVFNSPGWDDNFSSYFKFEIK